MPRFVGVMEPPLREEADEIDHLFRSIICTGTQPERDDILEVQGET